MGLSVKCYKVDIKPVLDKPAHGYPGIPERTECGRVMIP